MKARRGSGGCDADTSRSLSVKVRACRVRGDAGFFFAGFVFVRLVVLLLWILFIDCCNVMFASIVHDFLISPPEHRNSEHRRIS